VVVLHGRATVDAGPLTQRLTGWKAGSCRGFRERCYQPGLRAAM